MSIYSELDNLTLGELHSRFYGPPIDGDEYASSFYSEVAYLIRRKGEAGNEALWKDFNRPLDDERLPAIIFALSLRTSFRKGIVPLKASVREEFCNRLRMFLSDNRPFICAEAIDGLVNLEDRESKNIVLGLYKAPSPYVKGAVLRFLARLFPELATGYLLEALDDPHFIVRENAVDELSDLDIKEAIPSIRRLLQDSHPDVREAAEFALRYLLDDED